MTGKTQADLDAEATTAAAEREKAEANALLRSTDWYVIRNIEEGVDIPDNIRLERRAARLKAMT